MALTRARIIAGPAPLAAKIEQAIGAILTARRDHEKFKFDVADMRRRINDAHPPSSPWDVKYTPGGLFDVEFIAQYLQLCHARDRQSVLDTNTGAALAHLCEAGFLDSETAIMLGQGGKLWRTVQGMLRFTVEGPFDEEAASDGLKAALVRATGMEDFAALKHEMAATAARVRDTFIALIGDPDAIPAAKDT